MNFFQLILKLLSFIFGVRSAEASELTPVQTAPITPPKQSTIKPEIKPNSKIYVSRSEALSIIQSLNISRFNNFFDPLDILAICEIESSFDTSAYRYESHLNDASRGLMQILYLSAKDRGFKGTPENLYNPETNIYYGMAHMKWGYDYLKTRVKPLQKYHWIGAYNAGVGNVVKGYLPEDYISKWQKARARM